MTNNSLAALKEMIESATASLHGAQRMLNDLMGSGVVKDNAPVSQKLKSDEIEGDRIIEGVFSGEKMIGDDGRIYPVLANYASKSKLVEGDRLKLSILSDGRFIYKQTARVDRDFTTGTLTYEDGKYKVIIGQKKYQLITASVTFYKGQPGDEVAVIVSKDENATFACVENIIAKPMSEMTK